jgi:PIN domain nuclease of toxin-antitoxin system
MRPYISMQTALGVSAISCWVVAKLVEYGRLILPSPVAKCLDQALAYPGIRLLDLTPRIMVESTQLPGWFHHDPADQLIVVGQASASDHVPQGPPVSFAIPLILP